MSDKKSSKSTTRTHLVAGVIVALLVLVGGVAAIVLINQHTAQTAKNADVPLDLSGLQMDHSMDSMDHDAMMKAQN